MTDVEAVLTTILCIAGLYILWLHVRIRRLNDKLQDAALSKASTAVATLETRQSAEQEREMKVLRERVQVLERIATDGSRVLQDEIEALRRA